MAIRRCLRGSCKQNVYMAFLERYGLMSKKVLLTGGTGFVGQSVVSVLLKKGYEVHSLVNSPIVSQERGLFQYEIDLMSCESINKFFSEHNFENLIHLAWYVEPECYFANANLDWVVSSLNLLKAFKENGGRKFLGAGTVTEYEYKYGCFLENETPTDSRTLYGNSKNAVYNVAKVYCDQNGIDFKWPRIFNLYGPAEKLHRLMPSVINSCLRGEDVKVSDCLKFQDYLHVEDAARGIVAVFESKLRDAVNICSGKPVQLRHIVQTIAALTKFEGNIIWGAVPAAFKENLIVGNNEKLKSIGWKQEIDLEEGLMRTIDWWKNNNAQS